LGDIVSIFDASNNHPYMNFADIDGREIKVRPLWDAGLGRAVIELVADGTTVRVSNAAVPAFVDGVTMAAFVGEMGNVAQGTPTPAGE
jgi:hypothetical protein